MVPGQKPTGPVKLDKNHPLHKNLVVYFPVVPWSPYMEFVRNTIRPFLFTDASIYSRTELLKGELTLRVDTSRWGPYNVLCNESELPTNEMTMVFRLNGTGTSAQISNYNNADGAGRLQVAINYTNGTSYFDFGCCNVGQRLTYPNDGAPTNKLYTFTWHVGPGGIRITKDGVEVGADSTPAISRTNGNNTWGLGCANAQAGPDNQNYSFVILMNKQFSNDIVQSIANDPYQFLVPA